MERLSSNCAVLMSMTMRYFYFVISVFNLNLPDYSAERFVKIKDKRKKTKDKRQKAKGKRKKTKGKRQKAKDKRQKAKDKRQKY